MESFFQYFPDSPEISTWGIAVVGAGYAEILPGEPYPPVQHPDDHRFTWERGRSLDGMQVILVTKGCGQLETRGGGSFQVRQGSCFVLIPGEWHRYRPDPTSGWTESWCELRGPLVAQLVRDGVINADTPVRSGAVEAGMEEAFGILLRRSQNKALPGFDPQLSACAMHVLASWADMGREAAAGPDALRAVSQIERHLAAHFKGPVELEELARAHGLAYSHFRRLFKEATGYSPWQYVIHLRLGVARRMLCSPGARIGVVAEALGFSSAFHFSSAFRAAHGVSPSEWRRQNAREAPQARR